MAADHASGVITPRASLRLGNTRSPQPRILRLGLLQKRKAGVGVFPKREEILIGSPRLRGVSSQSVSSAQSQVSQRTDRFVQHDARVIENLLEFRGAGRALLRHQIRYAAQINRVK